MISSNDIVASGLHPFDQNELRYWCPWSRSQSDKRKTDPRDRRTSPCVGRPAMCISRSSSLQVVTEWLWSRGISCDYSRDLIAARMQVLADPSQWSMLLLAIDDFGGFSAVAEDLRALRQMVPKLAVIVVTGESSGDFGSDSSLVFGDATLRLPIDSEIIGVALSMAAVNSRRWFERMLSLGVV